MFDESDVWNWDVERLSAEIERHDRLYWEEDAPEIPDALYDQMVERLRSLDPDAPLLKRIGGRTGTDATATPREGRIEHSRPMLSLEKCYDEAQLLRWFERVGNQDALATPKIDGVALAIRYDAEGHLALGATRGDGRFGEDITPNVRRIQDVPARVDRPNIEVRGEAWLSLARFREHHAENFANPRNLCAGALKLKDPERSAAYQIRFSAYDLLGADDCTSEEGKHALLLALGFSPISYLRCSPETGQQTFETLSEERAALDYETDGIVFKVNDTATHERLGSTAHHPRWAIAYKYQGESGLSTLEDIEWSVSRTGAVNPVAIVAPVSLSGVTVRRVSLHNLGIMERLAERTLHIGDNLDCPLSPGARVLVTRRGGVIPHIESVAEPGHAALSIPTTCPSCGAETFREEDILRAHHNDDCATAAERRLEHFAKAIGADGLGPKLLAQLYAENLAREPADLFTLGRDELAQLERMGTRSADNLLRELDKARTLPLQTFLGALGIQGLGTRMATLLAPLIWERMQPPRPHQPPTGEDRIVSDRIDDTPAEPNAPESLDEEAQLSLGGLSEAADRSQAAPHPFLRAIAALAPADIENLEGFGEIMATRVLAGLHGLAPQIKRLLEHMEIEAPPEPTAASVDGPLAGRSFLFTGALERMKRSEAQQRVRELGGETPSSVTKDLTYLVIGDADLERFRGGWRTSKLKKAEAFAEKGHDIRIIGESEFLAMIDEASK